MVNRPLEVRGAQLPGGLRASKVTGSHVHWKSGNVSKMIQDRNIAGKLRVNMSSNSD